MLLEGLALVQVALQLADALLTKKILSRDGRELNPILRALGGKWLPVKLTVALGIVGFLYFTKNLLGLEIIDIAMAAAVAWNLTQLRR